jgi:PAS domain S-box-containing protein
MKHIRWLMGGTLLGFVACVSLWVWAFNLHRAWSGVALGATLFLALCLAAYAGYCYAAYLMPHKPYRKAGQTTDQAASMQDALLRTQKNLLKLAEQQADLLWIHTISGQISSCNGAFAAFFGIALKDTIGAPLLRVLGPDAAEALQNYSAAVQQGTDHPALDVWLTPTLGGEQRLFEVQQTPVWSERGTLLGVQAMARDVSLRRSQETLLKDTLAQLHLLQVCVDQINDVILISEAEPINAPGPRIVYVNPAFERMTGYTSAEVLGKSPRMLQGPRSSMLALARIRHALKNWQSVRVELINYSKSGREFWVELNINPVADASGYFTHWVAVQREITDRK